ncbi:MAG: efflux RND transporter permease subunit, partial [bacterium]
HILYTKRIKTGRFRTLLHGLFIVLGVFTLFTIKWWIGSVLILFGVFHLMKSRLGTRVIHYAPRAVNWIVIFIVAAVLSSTWAPLGYGRSGVVNCICVAFVLIVVMGMFFLFIRNYPRMFLWDLDHKRKIIIGPILLVVVGTTVWIGFGRLFGFMPRFIKKSRPYQTMQHVFPGLGKEFMPPLDEGSYLYMPTTMPHAGMEEASDVLRKIDMALYSVPEVEMVVGKLGRADSPLDPAPISMIETVVNYKPEYIVDKSGKRIKFKVDKDGSFVRDDRGELVPHKRGKPFRNWRDHIRTADDIWDELVKAAKLPGTTSAPRLQPISARLVMLQSGMRAPMGIKVRGPDLETIEKVGLELERFLKQVPAVESSAVFADRIVGKPYLEIEIDRRAVARYGIHIRQVQDIIETAIGGKPLTTTVEGRERYPVRVRYMRELRGDSESLEKILIPGMGGVQIPLGQLARINYVRGPQMIKSEDTFLVGYVLFDKKEGWAEVDVVEQAQRFLKNKIDEGELIIPAGVNYTFAGSYENQIRATERLRIILPLALFVIFLILYFQFRRVSTTLIVFSGIFVAWAGGFVMIWLWGQGWFMNFSFAGESMRTLFQMHPINLSVAVWVGFLALFGIATDDGVLITTYIRQRFAEVNPSTVSEIREATVFAGARRIRPAMMTTATTVLALIPVITSTGRGSDVMVPMAIPAFGGMVFEVLTVFVVPVLYTALAERRVRKNNKT